MAKSFTGRRRRKQTHWTVRAGDVVSQNLITIGGIGTIVAVSLVFFYLFGVVAPLFTSASAANQRTLPAEWQSQDDEKVVAIVIDEYRTMGWALFPDGKLNVFRLDSGEVLHAKQLFEGDARITVASVYTGTEKIAIGFDDGSVRVGEVGFTTSFYNTADVPERLRDLKSDGVAVWKEGMVQRTPQGQFRLQQVAENLSDPVSITDEPIRLIDHFPPEGASGAEQIQAAEYDVAVYAGDQAMLVHLTEEEDMFSGEKKLKPEIHKLPLKPRPKAPAHLFLFGTGKTVLAVWADGIAQRFDTRVPSEAKLVETIELLPRDGSDLTLCDLILGRETLLVGDTRGRLSAWFMIRDRDLSDGFHLRRIHDLGTSTSPPTALGASRRSRMVAVGHRDGQIRIYHVTTQRKILERRVEGGDAIDRVLITAKDDGVVALAGDRMWSADFDPAHPEATAASLFFPVWYEGYALPTHRWQSSYATSAPEMKLGLVPLIFGTLKATFYTMLFAAPLALLAAIYTSEFLDQRWRARIKPAIEMMASLPSVVLGFLAALVIAQYIETIVPATLACFATVPLVVLLGAQIFNLLPTKWCLFLSRYRMLYVMLAIPIGIAVAVLLAPAIEGRLFAGDIKLWLDGQIGDGTGAWMMLWLPASAFAMWVVVGVVINPMLRRVADRMSRQQFALLNCGKFIAATGLMLLMAYGVSRALTGVGWDPRGSYVATYEQRNSLVVGFLMGFAVIPIIYTIADDALRTVPDHLRSASLGCGATPWQTAVRVVIPTAMSGLFSALMIGLGRAVGETMIVLMAGGNTPHMDWNMFNGFRTLSANIAVELPEAVVRSTHYRTLFLAALTLFVMTFFVNTLAELVRLHFRKRAYQL